MRNHFGVPTLKRPKGKLIWVHAVSVGESLAALTFINHIKKKFPDLNVLITTITVTSAENLAAQIEKIDGCFHQFAVFDNHLWVEKFLDHWKIDVAVLLESEIWPSIIYSLNQRKIPTFLLNARLSQTSFTWWKIVKSFLSDILGKFDAILAQSEIDAEKYKFFSPNNVKRIDNLKFANALLPCKENLLKIFEKICSKKKVLVAVSTHETEEKIIVEAHKKLSKELDLVTILIPRHASRIKSVCEALKKCNVRFFLRSQINEDKTTFENINDFQQIEVFCVDIFGEVGTFLRLADVCFVGGSLVPVGGHNIYEPVMFGKPVLHGPYMDNTIEVRDLLKENKLAFEVKNELQIYEVCKYLLLNSALLKDIYAKAISLTENKSLKQIDDAMQLEKILYTK